MAKKSLISALAIGAGLALAGNATAQQYNFTQEKVSDADKSVFMRTGDLIFDTDYRPALDRTETTDMNTLIRGGNVTAFYAMDAIEALNSRINYLKTNPEANKYFTKDAKDLLIGRYNILIKEISKEKRSPNYKFSLEKLSDSVKDGIITPEELMGVEDGTYCFVKEGTDSGKGYAVFALRNLSKRIMTEPSRDAEYESKIRALEGELKDARNKNSGFENQIPKANEKPAEQIKPVVKVKPANTSDFKPYWSLTAGANTNTTFDNLEGNVGARFYPAKGLGFGVSADVGVGKDKVLDSYEDILIDSLRAVGTERGTNNFSLGLSVESQLGPFLLGVGASYNSRITEKTVELLEGDEVIKSNSDSIFETGFSRKIYGGVEIPISKKFGVDVIGGYKFGKSGSGAFGGVKLNFKLKK
jgi:hypothetical protein